MWGENKMNYKHNDKVTAIIYGTEIKDARISIDSYGIPFICQNLIGGCDVNDKLGYKYSWRLNKDFTDPDVTDLKLFEKNWDTLEAGDIIISSGAEALVIDVLPNSFLRSYFREFKLSCNWYSKKEAISQGWTIKQSTPETETIEIAGKRYSKEEFEKATKDLKEVK